MWQIENFAQQDTLPKMIIESSLDLTFEEIMDTVFSAIDRNK